MPSCIEMITSQQLLVIPMHVVAWVDTHANQNNQITLYVQLSPGHPKLHYTVKIMYGGSLVHIKYTWPKEMLSSFILTKGGHNMYYEGHSKLIAFDDHVTSRLSMEMSMMLLLSLTSISLSRLLLRNRRQVYWCHTQFIQPHSQIVSRCWW